MKILITGGCGFIGSHLVEFYQNKADIRVLDNLNSGFRRNLLNLDVEIIEGDIRDRETVKKSVQDIDVVFHLAALISVPESMSSPIYYNEVNVRGLLTVLEEASVAGVEKLIFSSSAANYGDSPIIPKIETMKPDPKSPYAVNKLDGEYYCEIFNKEGRIKTTALRYFNVYGPRQDPKSAYAAAIPLFISKALRGEPVTIFGDGEQTRDFIYVKEVAAANAFMAEHRDLTGVFNVGSGCKLTVNELAKKIIEITDSSSEIQHLPERLGDVKHSQASIEKLLGTGFQHRGNFEEGLIETMKFFLETR